MGVSVGIASRREGECCAVPVGSGSAPPRSCVVTRTPVARPDTSNGNYRLTPGALQPALLLGEYSEDDDNGRDRRCRRRRRVLLMSAVCHFLLDEPQGPSDVVLFCVTPPPLFGRGCTVLLSSIDSPMR